MERRRLLDGWATAALHAFGIPSGTRVSGVRNIVQAGERIYAEKYRQRFEASYADQFAAASSWVEAMAIWR
jgi:hypothetical protein